jgi:hypothetical protein
MAETRFVLRQLAGVADLEARLQRIEEHPNPEWAPDNQGLEAHANIVSERLFGLIEEETRLTWWDVQHEEGAAAEFERRLDEYERHFRFIYDTDDAAKAIIWDAMGWDVTDGAGERLRCLPYLARQMVCATKGLKGRLPDAAATDSDVAEQAEKWGDSLAAEAARFKRGRR